MDEYIGDGIMIEERLENCIITDKVDGECVVISTVEDAKELIIALGNLIISLEK
jgi:hypothetical protein